MSFRCQALKPVYAKRLLAMSFRHQQHHQHHQGRFTHESDNEIKPAFDMSGTAVDSCSVYSITLGISHYFTPFAKKVSFRKSPGLYELNPI